ncbi:Uncharacterised protein [Salmonella enterica subsp. enterica]|uniref:Uncharacterized protein n=1 Tax=Salmonella enterica I TaxID=59201 RepID=A0A447N5R6_SALET|nr:Uncharacterised protein [Salmonella enterica subsp. enterica]
MRVLKVKCPECGGKSGYQKNQSQTPPYFRYLLRLYGCGVRTYICTQSDILPHTQPQCEDRRYDVTDHH